MRIAFIRQRYNPFGGAERFVERATSALAEDGAAVTLIAREWSPAAELSQGERRLIRCDPPYLGRLWRDLSFKRAVCRLLDRERFDLVQSHERLACCDVYRAGDGVHAQWLAHRARAQSALGRAFTCLSPYHRYVVAAERRLYSSPQVRAVICNSQMVRADILRHFPIAPAKLRVIYNGVDLEHFHPRVRDAHRAETRLRLDIRDADMVYLFVGAGFARKGVDRLLRSFTGLELPNARLVIVGKDHALSRSRRLAERLGIAPRVAFAGGQHDVRPFYAAADAFVLPSLYDPFPNAAVEALACGLPVVTTFQSGAAELIRPGENGAVCDALDEVALTRALFEVARLDPVATPARARASVAHLGIGAMGKELLALYRELLSGTTERPDSRDAKARGLEPVAHAAGRGTMR